MQDAVLTTIAAIGLGAALTAAVLDHAERDDRVREAHADCRVELATERLVSDVCMAVVDDCRAVMESSACACWRVE